MQGKRQSVTDVPGLICNPCCRAVPERGLTVTAPDGVTGDYDLAKAGHAAGELGVRRHEGEP